MKPTTQFIGLSESAKTLRNLVATMANSNATVMITGESGTGKELLARLLHDQSELWRELCTYKLRGYP